MSFSNAQIEVMIKEKNTELEEAVNLLEASMKDEIDFDRGTALFHLGRVETLYAGFQALLKNQHIL